MKAFVFIVGVLLSINLWAGVKKYPVRDFFKNPEVTAFQISPDGKNLAFMKPWEGRMNIFVRPTSGGEEKRLSSVKDRDIGGFFWKGNQSIIYGKDFGGDENFHVFSINLVNGKEVDMTPFPKVQARVLDTLENVSETDFLISMNKIDAKLFDVYRLNSKTGAMKLVAKNNGKITSWLTDHLGKVRLATETDGVNNTLLYRAKESDSFKVLRKLSFKEHFTPSFFTFDNKRLFVLSDLNRDKLSVVEYDPEKNEEVRIVYQNTNYDVGYLNYSRKRKVLSVAGFNSWKNERVYFDLYAEKVASKIQEKVPGVEVNIVSSNKEEDLFIVRTYSDRTLGAFYLYDAKKDDLVLLAKLGTHLDENDMAEMKPIEYRSRDGLLIRGYLTLPKGVEAKKLPVIVNPHGGPWHRDSWGFNPQVQFLANRGYAVLQMNFRGSTGYGNKFWQASFKQWGQKMQDDVTDGVQSLIDQGVADAKNICIYGGSYGGYTTLAGITFTPNLYKCAVDYVGVSNLFTFLQTIPPYWKPLLEQLYEMVGHPEKDKEMLTKYSPALNADKIKAPLFVAQGANDPRVVKAESDQMVEALKKRGIEVQYMVKNNEGHGFRNEENRFEFYEAMEKFLAEHLN